MQELWVVLGVVGLFLLRIGLPVLLIVLVGLLIEHWQRQNEEEIRRYYASRQNDDQLPEGAG